MRPEEFLDILPAMNLMNDADLTNVAAELNSILMPIDRLRQDKRLRADTARKADAILAKMP